MPAGDVSTAALTPLQKRFCEEYVVDMNMTHAAIRAGYAPKNAYRSAARILKLPAAESFINSLREGISRRTRVTADMVVMELARIGFQNVKDYVDDNNNVLDMGSISRSKAAAIASVKRSYSKEGEVVYEVKLHDKVAALEKLGRHLGIFERDNSQQNKLLVKMVGYGPEE